MEINCYTFLASALGGSELSVSCSSCINHEEIGSRYLLDVRLDCPQGKFRCSAREKNPITGNQTTLIQLTTSHYPGSNIYVWKV
jgi:hypothetical protein